MTNYEKIKQMSVEEMINADEFWIEINCSTCHRMNRTEKCVRGCCEQLKIWLESEAETK